MSMIYREQKNLLTIIKVICDKILLKNGPFLKEGIYQEILFHEISQSGLIPKISLVSLSVSSATFLLSLSYQPSPFQ